MGGTSKKNPKTKPTKLTEFFQNPPSQNQDVPKGRLFPPDSPTPSSRAESVDLESQEAVDNSVITESSHLPHFVSSFNMTLNK